ncbi:MAG: hypothetical protein ACRDNZ_03810, partial [Streptosporangiaceae bacterium]
VAIASALAGRPEVLLADEITSALDASTQGMILNLVRDLQRQINLSMLFISHDLAVVRYMSDLIAVLYLGRIVECGPTGQILADPQHPYTRALLAAAPRRDALALADEDPGPAERAVADAEPPIRITRHPAVTSTRDVLPGRLSFPAATSAIRRIPPWAPCGTGTARPAISLPTWPARATCYRRSSGATIRP